MDIQKLINSNKFTYAFYKVVCMEYHANIIIICFYYFISKVYLFGIFL